MKTIRIATALIAGALIATLGWCSRQEGVGVTPADSGDARVAVEAAPVETGSIADVRSFTGTLEAGDSFTVAPKLGGRIQRVHVDIGDAVEQGQIVAELDDDEATQAVAEAQAELAVARAEVEQAAAEARLARRDFERTRSLAERELASQSELDTTRAQADAREAAVAVAEARVTQREAALARARVQLGYTEVRAGWSGGDHERVVGERMVSAGDTVAANAPLVSVLGIDPITAAVFAPESDYARLSVGQAVEVSADALPERAFMGRISRIAPRFASDSRQARFEVNLPNGDRALKPGMFVTVRVTVATSDDTTLVPAEAIVRREAGPGVYRVIEGDPPTVRFVPVTLGIEGAAGVEIRAPELSGRVVTLGQQMLEDDAPVIVSEGAR